MVAWLILLVTLESFSTHMKPKRFVLPWWMGFSVSLLLPITFLVFLFTGPHRPWLAVAFTFPVWALIAWDYWSKSETRWVPSEAPGWFFDGLLYLLALFQIVNLLAMGVMVMEIHWGGLYENVVGCLNLVVLRILGGTTFCCSVIAPAHELIHRRSKWQHFLGRFMLLLTFYDHFAIAHRQGHHARLGSQADPSTAEAGETYEAFFWRSLNRQWQVALRAQPHRVWLGVLLGGVLMLGYGLLFGGLALFAWIYISGVAIRLLESVNYFQHYGLTLSAPHASRTAWRCDSKLSYFLFLGLTRHADHHRRPGIPYQELQSIPHALKLPRGYLWTAIWVKNRNADFRRWAQAEALRVSRPVHAKTGRPLALATGQEAIGFAREECA